MKDFLTVILFFIFFIVFSLAVLAFSINAVLNPNFVKKTLKQGQVYSKIAANFPQLVGNHEGSPTATEQKIKSFVEKEISPEFLQTKIEKFIDDIFRGFEGKAQGYPTLDLTDLSQKLEAQGLAAELPSQIQTALKAPIQVSWKVLGPMRTIYQWLKIIPWAGIIIGALCLAALFFLEKSIRTRLHQVSLAIFLPTIFGVIQLIELGILVVLIIGVVSSLLSDSQFGGFLGVDDKVLAQVPQQVVLHSAAILGVAFLVSLVLFFASFFFKKEEH